VARIKKISLDFDNEPIRLQLVSIKENLSLHKFFFEMNKQNKFKCKRIKNFIVHDNSIEHEFLYMKSYDEEENSICSFIANKSFKNSSNLDNISVDIFGKYDHNEYYLFNAHKNIDFIMKIHDSYIEFSLHLLPKNLVSFVEETLVKPKDLVYQYIQENE